MESVKRSSSRAFTGCPFRFQIPAMPHMAASPLERCMISTSGRMILLIDYGAGNLASIANMLRKAGFEATISSKPEDVLRAQKVILPGVGHFDEGMRQLDARGLVEPLRRKVIEERTPLLGIC